MIGLHVSVVVPTKNRALLLRDCLRAIARQTYPPKEVFIIDNGSQDNTKEVVHSMADVLPIQFVQKLGVSVSEARNVGVRLAKGSIVAFIDDDCTANTNWIASIELAVKNGAHVMLGKSLNGFPGNLYAATAYLYVERALRQQLLQNGAKTVSANSIVPISGFFDTKNAAITKKALASLPYTFDRTLPIYVEDVDLGIRLRKLGLRIFFNPNMIVSHNARPSLGSLLHGRYKRGFAYYMLQKKWHQNLIREKKIQKLFKEESQQLHDREKKNAHRANTEVSQEIIGSLGWAAVFFPILTLLANLVWQIGYAICSTLSFFGS